MFDQPGGTIMRFDTGGACGIGRSVIRLDAFVEARLNRARIRPGGKLRMRGPSIEVPSKPRPAGSSASGVPADVRAGMPESKAITILLADNDETEVVAIRHAFRQLNIANPLVVARNGLEALDMLRGLNGHEKIPSPYLILLTLDMPRMGGIEFLAELRGDPALRRALVFVLAASAAEVDSAPAYEKNVAGCIVKDRPGLGIQDVIAALADYWRAIEFPD